MTLPRGIRKSHLRRLSKLDRVKPGTAQILKGISLVTFFVPAKKVTRSSAGGVEALAMENNLRCRAGGGGGATAKRSAKQTPALAAAPAQNSADATGKAQADRARPSARVWHNPYAAQTHSQDAKHRTPS